jgi:hypothetical protein
MVVVVIEVRSQVAVAVAVAVAVPVVIEGTAGEQTNISKNCAPRTPGVRGAQTLIM